MFVARVMCERVSLSDCVRFVFVFAGKIPSIFDFREFRVLSFRNN